MAEKIPRCVQADGRVINFQKEGVSDGGDDQYSCENLEGNGRCRLYDLGLCGVDLSSGNAHLNPSRRQQ